VLFVAKKREKTTPAYTPVSLPTPMVSEAKEIVENHPELGYTGHTEFAKDALREKIEKVRLQEASKAEVLAQ